MSDLDDLVPRCLTVRAKGRDIEVSALRMRQIPAFSKAIAQPWLAIISGEYLAAIMEWPDEIAEAVAVATGLDRKFLADLLPNEFLDLATAVLEVNLDFFARAVFPASTKLGQRIAEIAQTHSASLQGSSATDTATRTSSTSPSLN